MYLVFSQISAPAPENYIRTKLQQWSRTGGGRGTAAAEFDQTTINAMLTKLGSFEFPLADPGAVPMTEAQASAVKTRSECLRNTINSCCGLLPGETVIEDHLSFLTAAYAGVPAKTPVMRRTTNLAELYFLVNELSFADGKLVATAHPPTTERVAVTAVGMVASLAKNLGIGIVKGIGKSIGTDVVDKVMPGDGVPSYFDAVYTEITKIVNQAVTQNTIDEINGNVNGINSWIQVQYTNKKNDPTSTKTQLSSMLAPQVTVMYDSVMGPLMTAAYAEAGFSVFMLAAPMHLAMIQEQALQDPNHAQANDSSYAKSVEQNAKSYQTFAVATFNQIVADRKAFVVMDYASSSYNGYGTIEAFYSWADGFDGSKSNTFNVDPKDDDGDAKAQAACNADMQNHITAVINDLTAQLADPMTTANGWVALETAPIPNVSAMNAGN
jgi:hypothetical protein